MEESGAIIGEIYAAVLDKRRWQNVVDGIVKTFPGLSASFQYFNVKRDSMPFIVHNGYSRETLRDYAAHFYKLNPLAEMAARKPVGTPIGTNLENWNELTRSDFYQDFLLKNNLGGGYNVVVSRSLAGFMHLTLDYEFKRHDKLDASTINAHRILTPHLARAFDLLSMLDVGASLSCAVQELVELLHVPAILFDYTLRIVAENRRATMLLKENFGISCQNERLEFSSLKAAAFVQKAADSVRNSNTTDVCLPYILLGPRGRVLLRMWPIPNKGTVTGGNFRLGDLPPPLICLTATLIDEIEAPMLELATKLFSLTDAEAKLARAIAGGMELNVYADLAHLSRHTVRNQLKAVFSKMGVSRQLELALLMLKLQE